MYQLPLNPMVIGSVDGLMAERALKSTAKYSYPAPLTSPAHDNESDTVVDDEQNPTGMPVYPTLLTDMLMSASSLLHSALIIMFLNGP